MSPLQFDAANHTYTLDGQRLTGVTELLGAVLKTESQWWKPIHRMRGKFVHLVTEAIDAGDWDPALMVFPERWTPEDCGKVIQRGKAYQRFLDESGFVSQQNELQVFSRYMGMAGTVDKVGRIGKGKYRGRKAIVDVKSGLPTAAAQLQLAFYEHFYNLADPEPKQPVDVRVILHLQPNGAPRAEYREGLEDRSDAIAVWRTYQFMKREGLL